MIWTPVEQEHRPLPLWPPTCFRIRIQVEGIEGTADRSRGGNQQRPPRSPEKPLVRVRRAFLADPVALPNGFESHDS